MKECADFFIPKHVLQELYILQATIQKPQVWY